MSSIELSNVCLDYILVSKSDSLKRSFFQLLHKLFSRHNHDSVVQSGILTYRALNNITISLNKGDRVGILGRNGAGKSTLLRVLANIYRPDIGTIKIQGNLSTLFDISLGMNVDATGYENVVNLAIMRGYSLKEANKIVPDIECFTELGNFLQFPVQTYSSGMQMKLAFAVATALPTEILLIDEIIGVGDAKFMEKAQKRISSIIEQCQILVLTSHSLDIIKKFCNKVIVLDKGEIQFIGEVAEGIALYNKILFGPVANT